VGCIVPLCKLTPAHEIVLLHIGLVDLIAVALAGGIPLGVDFFDSLAIGG
jgi:hypothetical protein